jgi:Ca2+-transporting ATPase
MPHAAHGEAAQTHAESDANRVANASTLTLSRSRRAPSTLKKQASSYGFHDGMASVEEHIALLLEDLIRYGSQATLSAAEDMVLREAFLGLHYVWRMRIRGSSLTAFTPELMERLRVALLLFMGRVDMRGPVPFLAKPVPTREAVFAFTIFCGMLKDVNGFREVVNTNMTLADLRRALAVHQWLSITEVEEDEEEPDRDLTHTVGWSSIKFSIEDIRRLAIVTVFFLTDLLNACNDWTELVEPRAHALFQKYQKDAKLEAHPNGLQPKPLLAPKGEYWDTDVDKVLGMFRTKIEAGLTEAEVLARREVYGDNRTPPMARASVLGILFRQLADLIVVILLVACIVSACLGDFKTAVVLGVVVSINTAIGFYQEWNAERAISALASLSVPQCTVIRGGTPRMADAGDLVPGDIVVLDEGAAVPADLRLCNVSQLGKYPPSLSSPLV